MPHATLEQPAFSPASLQKIRDIIARYPEGRQKSALLPVLHMAQAEFGGWLSVPVMDYVAGLLALQPIEVYEVATFYSMFRLSPTGKYVLEVCRTGPCCLVGAEKITAHLKKTLGMDVGETTPDGLFTLLEVECLASCGTGPVLQLGEGYVENLSPESVDQLVSDLRAHEANR
jgi:NADH-quinone oxidoreductase subunit E